MMVNLDPTILIKRWTEVKTWGGWVQDANWWLHKKGNCPSCHFAGHCLEWRGVTAKWHEVQFSVTAWRGVTAQNIGVLVSELVNFFLHVFYFSGEPINSTPLNSFHKIMRKIMKILSHGVENATYFWLKKKPHTQAALWEAYFVVCHLYNAFY